MAGRRSRLRWLFDGFEDFGGVAFGGRFVPDFGDAAVRSDQKSGAHDPEVRFAKKLLHSPCAIGFDRFEFLVAQHREIQTIFGAEFSLCFDAIAAATQDDCA